MKPILIPLFCIILASAAVAGEVEKAPEDQKGAETEKTTTTTTTTTTTRTTTRSEDRIVEVVPERTVVIRERSGPPVYRYDREVIYEARPWERLREEEVRVRVPVARYGAVRFWHEGERRYLHRAIVGQRF